jgi:ribosome recycling factor
LLSTADGVMKDSEHKMNKTVESTEREFSTIRTGRAHTSIVEGIMVEYYGTETPIKQLATISTPEPRLVVIQPWDRSCIGDVEKAILKSDLGITPNNDGKLVRIAVPQLTKERRDELDKVIKKVAEEGRVSLRTARRVANENIEKLEKDKVITEDEKFKYKDRIQKLTDKSTKEIDEHLARKEREIQEV